MRVRSFNVQEVDKSVDGSDIVSSELRIFWESPVQLVNPEANNSRRKNPDEAVGLGLREIKSRLWLRPVSRTACFGV